MPKPRKSLVSLDATPYGQTRTSTSITGYPVRLRIPAFQSSQPSHHAAFLAFILASIRAALMSGCKKDYLNNCHWRMFLHWDSC